jgi:hypothetical protein
MTSGPNEPVNMGPLSDPRSDPLGVANDPVAARAAAKRIDPTGKHALFSAPPAAARDQLGPGNAKDGRQAFFSTGPRQTGTVVVKCSACHTRTRVTLLDLGVRLVSISAWIPRRRYSHWMRCPSCHQHNWCDIGWND